VIGSVGFRAAPDPSGRVELGHIVAERRKGSAREAIAGLTAWAFATGRARVCVASVSSDNGASLELVRSLGFCQFGQQIDEIDELGLVFEWAPPLEPDGVRRAPGKTAARPRVAEVVLTCARWLGLGSCPARA
jgi:hypothetical protein